jgi:hypothetical protein
MKQPLENIAELQAQREAKGKRIPALNLRDTQQAVDLVATKVLLLADELSELIPYSPGDNDDSIKEDVYRALHRYLEEKLELPSRTVIHVTNQDVAGLSPYPCGPGGLAFDIPWTYLHGDRGAFQLILDADVVKAVVEAASYP